MEDHFFQSTVFLQALLRYQFNNLLASTSKFVGSFHIPCASEGW